jgi:ferric-dicitrate binding protein FerR (iron transport regulator)
MTREQALEIILSPRGSPPAGSGEHREFVEFLSTSPECRRLWEQQQLVWKSMDDWRAPELSAAFDRRLFAQIEAEQRRKSWLERLLGGFRLPLAATVAVLLVVAASVIRQQSPAMPEAVVAVSEPAESQYVEQINRALDDLEMLADFASPQPSGELPGES